MQDCEYLKKQVFEKKPQVVKASFNRNNSNLKFRIDNKD